VAYSIVTGVSFHSFVKWPASLHVEAGSHPLEQKFVCKKKVSVGIQSEHLFVVRSGSVGFPPAVNGWIPSLQEDELEVRPPSKEDDHAQERTDEHKNAESRATCVDPRLPCPAGTFCLACVVFGT
jgi:hypothetical protein